MSVAHVSSPMRRSTGMERLAHFVGRYVTPARFAWPTAAGIALLGVIGILHTTGVIDVPVLDLDGEYNVPSVYSAVLLSCAAAAALLYGAVRVDDGPQVWPAALLAVLLAFLAADEFGQIHERVEVATGIDFMVLYAPLVLICGVAWLLVLRRLWARATPRLLFIGGAAAWSISQLLEDLQWHDDIGDGVHAKGYEVMMIFEELLEFEGSWMFCLALLMPIAAAAALSRADDAKQRASQGHPSLR